MPRIESYVGLAPFSIDELVEAANSILRNWPRFQVSRRTVRYYVSERVLPSPDGSPKYARYGTTHLLRLIGARCLLDRGEPLERWPVELDRLLSGSMSESVARIQSLVDGMEDTSSAAFAAPAPMAVTETRHLSISAPPTDLVRRIPLSDGMILEVPGALPPKEALEKAAQSIERLLGDDQASSAL